MGIVSTSYNYLLNLWRNGSSPPLTDFKIRVSATKLIHYLKLREEELQKHTKRMEEELLVQLKTATAFRNARAQEVMMRNVVANCYRLAAYEQIITCARMIKVEARNIAKRQNLISRDCQVALKSLFFAFDALYLDDYVKMDELIPKPYPKVEVEEISVALKQCVNPNTSFQTINTYVLEMCVRHQLQLDTINKAGHRFLYNPSKQEQNSKSSLMFALQIDHQQNQYPQHNPTQHPPTQHFQPQHYPTQPYPTSNYPQPYYQPNYPTLPYPTQHYQASNDRRVGQHPEEYFGDRKKDNF